MCTKIIVRIFLIANFLTIFASAQNYNDAIRVGFPGLGPDARALGMGNAFVAVGDNAAATFYNPAGLALIKSSMFTAGFDFSNFNNDVSFMGNETSSKTNSTKFNQASIILPFPTKRGSMVVGIGFNQSKDLSGIVEFDGFNSGGTSKIQSLLDTDIPFDLYLTDELNNTIINGNLNQSGTILNTGAINNWDFSGAVEVAKNTFIGGSFTIHTGSFESNNDYYEDDTQRIYEGITAAGEPQTEDFRTFNLNNLLRWDIGGWSGKLGMIYQWVSFMRLGLTIQFPKIYTIEENFNVNGSSEFGTGQKYFLDTYKYSDLVKYDIQTPYEFSAGAAFNLSFLIITGQANIIDYTQMEFKNPEGIDPLYFSERNADIKKFLRVAYNANVGAELSLPLLPIKLRAGAIYQQSPFEDDDPAFDRKYLTAGVGFNFEGVFGIDIAYAYGWWKDIADNYDVDVSRTYHDIKEQTVMLTTTFRF
jgi:long-subunit fatty acid transport protein